MDVDPEGDVLPRRPGGLQESQEEPDECGITVRECHVVVPRPGLVLRTFAPVGDRASDDELTVGQGTDPGSCCRASSSAAGFLGEAPGRPVASRAFGRSLPTFGGA